MRDTTSDHFPIVGLGASAGGLEALQVFFSNVDPQFEAAYVLVQHLSPDFKSKMDELLARKVALPITVATDGMKVEAGRIYLMPPRSEMVISDGALQLIKVDNNDHLSLPIDHFLKSLAREAGSRAIGVILSGTGTDGSRGLAEIHDAGGLAIVQTAETAKFTGMIDAATATGKFNFQIDPEAIPRAIANRARDLDPRTASIEYDATYDEATKAVLLQLRNLYGVDFTQYNPTMILRRINRRMALVGSSDPQDYLRRLAGDENQTSQLFHDLLIGVSSFFRDDTAMQALDEKAIQPLVQKAQPNDEIRVWVEGCATGQEAYTLGILFLEAIRESGKDLQLKVFATDVHKESLEIAGRGIYEKDDLETVEETLRDRYFEQKGLTYRPTEELRSVVIFAVHNALVSPPFTRMDLISCRNMLIYFKPSAKKKVLSLLNFGLKRDGYLFLGSSESPFGQETEFETVDKRAKIYRKIEATRTSPASLVSSTFSTMPQLKALPAYSQGWDERFSQSHLIRTYESLLEQFMPRSLLIDSDYTVLHTFNQAEEFIKLPGGRANVRIPDCLPAPLRNPVSALLRRVKNSNEASRLSGIKIGQGKGDPLELDLSARPLWDSRTKSSRFLLAIETAAEAVALADRSPREKEAFEMPDSDHLKSLEDELSSTQENLHAAIEELEASNEELQATNEELVASNEELQSTNEELQSVNEELQTVNAEHQQKIIELSEVTNDLENLLVASQVGVFFLDADLNIKRFTPLVAKLFHLKPGDTNRPIEDFKSDLDYPQIYDDLKKTCQQQSPFEKQVTDKQGTPYLVRLFPYHDGSEFRGAVCTLVDVSSISETEKKARLLSSIVSSSTDAIFTVSLDGELRSWNEGAEALFGYPASQVLGKNIREVFGSTERANTEIDRYLSEIRRGRSVEPFETERLALSGKLKQISVQVSPLLGVHGELVGASIIDRDITEFVRNRDVIKRQEAESRLILESLAEGIIRLDAHGVCVALNTSAVKILGFTKKEDVLAKPLYELFNSNPSQESVSIPNLIEKGRSPSHQTNALKFSFEDAAGKLRHIEFSCNLVKHSEGGHVVTFLDISERIQYEKERDWLTTVVHSSLDLISSTDLEGRLTFMNTGGRQLLGINRKDDITRFNLSDIHPPEILERIQNEGLPQALKHGHWSGTTSLVDRSGRIIPISQSIYSHKNGDGETYAISTICRDMSDYSAYEDALKQSEAESRRYATTLANVIDNIPEFLLVVNRDSKLEFASQSTRSLLNTLGFDDEIPSAVRTLTEQVLETGKPYVAYDYTGIIEFNFGAQTRFLLPRIQPNFEKGRNEGVTGATLLLQDVTEFRLLDKIKSDLLSTVSHELKTPVTSVRMALLLMLDEKERLDETQSVLIETAAEETERLLRTLNSLLDLTRFESGRKQLELKAMPAGDVVRDIMQSFDTPAKLQGLKINLELEPELPEVMVDLHHIRHALGNLIGNAIKHSPTHGTITVRCEVLEEPTRVEFSVSDEGPGVPDELHERIFERFFKAPTNTKPGSGLGLNIAKEFVTAQRGEIGVRNNNKNGATFYIALPYKS
ncbi:chemotaxis protein CheB [Pelagicoccus sp. SDUM812002]|uniref:chemotaxis protein CheB n=1 Tax=Pelagicoccus sp. SDUM812002 TaxID=3041266 RepID=UPI00280D13D8|nr:chemotaxis protein CheB [Pelagicoccus sp. SDUM812002]MDQ8187618.1 chemotaxis protein CheB [Pelagicoccus sp. SDUM812002]